MAQVPQVRSTRYRWQRNAGGFAHAPLTVAFLCSSPGGVYSFEKWLMWRGIAEAAREYGVNLIYLAGEEQGLSPQAVLYDLVGEHNVDGVIVWGTFVHNHATPEKTAEFMNWYVPLPVVSIELEVPGSTNVLVDNDQGMRDLLSHLVEGHGYQKIALVGRENSQPSRIRRAAFEKHINRFGLHDSTLIGTFEELDARGVRWGRDVRAVLATSDYVGVKLVETFRQRGLRVPEDVAVVGFNDGQEARGSLPPLTTVRLPFRNMGRKAVELLVKRIGGDTSLLEDTYLAPQLILRRSCGCLEPMAEQAAAGIVAHARADLHAVLDGLQRSLPEQMAYGMGTSIESLAQIWSRKLFELFSSELSRKLFDPTMRVPGSRFLIGVNDLLREAVAEGANVTRWHEALTLMRMALLPYLEGELLSFGEDMFHQARVLVGQIAVRLEVHRTWNTARRNDILREIESALLVAAEVNELMEILQAGLAQLKIQDAYLVLYEDTFDPQGQARLALAIENGERMEIHPEQAVFAVRDLLPQSMMNQQSYCMVVEALQQREEQIGYLVIKTDPPAEPDECDVYQSLRIMLSGALLSVRLRQKLQDARRVAEEANHLKSRFLSMVSHELRTPLNLIVGLSEMAMRQQARGADSLDVLLKFLEQIYVSGQHLDRLIRDVLDLASSQVGQMTLISKPLDLLPVIEDVACMGEQLARQKNLDFRVEVPESLPPVLGDKTRLRQILLNLLSNAVKFTAHGEVALLVSLDQLALGDQILVQVRDTGLGIAPEEQEKIFDEFQQSDRSLERGYGGIGLGLAITRRLVEMHGGRIWVSSSGEEGGGSTFNFTLPVLAESSEPPEAPAQPSLDRQGVVLIVSLDDSGDGCGEEPAKSKSLAVHLIDNGFKVEEICFGTGQATDSGDLVESLVAAPPGAMVLDLAPASEQGWEIVKRIKEHPALQDIPVLFYALMAEDGEEGPAGTVLELDYMTKPVGADSLVRALKRHGLLNAPVESGHTILIVDDEPGILDLHARMVQTELPACRVVTARDGLEGLKVMRSERPDLVLLDLMMPELDGFGVLKAMQSEEMLRNIPVMVLSGQVLTRREMMRLNQGVAAVLGKGLFTNAEIVARIEGALARNRRVGGEVQRLVQQAMAFIHEHYQSPISRADVANHLSINEQYLSRCFNKELGIGPMVYLSRYRIQRARRLLEQGNMSITQVAMEVGMSSQSYFSRVFQEEMGVTPSQYQRGVRSEKG